MSIVARFRVVRGDFVLDVDLSLPSQGITALFGPSGSGKTTLLRSIAGLDRHQDGYLKVGDNLWQEGERFVPPHRRSLGYVFQEASLFTHLTVRDNLEYGLKRVSHNEHKISLDSTIELLGISPLLDRRPDTLSGGERQRVAIARALAVSPGLLLMDEPLAALDRASKQEILPYLESLHDELEIPVIYVTHISEEVSRLADHLILLEAGRVVATGAISEMLTRLDLPLAHGNDAAAMIEVVVASHDEVYQLTHLDFRGGRINVARIDQPVGHRLRLRILAQDVSVILEPQVSTSILNVFPVTVDEVFPDGGAQVTLRLLAEGVPILSRITRKSAVELDLKPGKSVYAQVKSVVLLT
ncbi:MAG: molybdenum ABC transporter ATP-binding protein [Chloroflexi bacterium]|nr:molybdenum ABC transporter ATP-binding protein [Chloroflexota bacterium]